jgi:hypothetical protein
MSRLIYFAALIFVSNSWAAGPAATSSTDAVFNAKAYHRFWNYTDSNDKNSGQDHLVFLQQRIKFNSVASVKMQIYGFAGNSKADLIQASDRIDYRSQTTEVWPGEVYASASVSSFLLKAGYQKVSWQEGFALTYTNFINPQDVRASIFDDPDQTYRTTPMANAIWSGENISLQAIYMPYSQNNIQAPISRGGATFSTGNQTIETIKPNQTRPSHEYGTRATWAGSGFDASVFYAHLRDRHLTYSFSPLSTIDRLQLDTQQEFINPVGVTTSFNVSDYIVRLEYMEIAQRNFNQLQLNNLTVQSLNEKAITIGFDSPGGQDFSFLLQHSISMLDQDIPGVLRKKTESLTYGSVNFNMKQERTFSFSAVHLSADESLFSRFSYKWPLSKRAEFELAYESSTGKTPSQGASVKDLNRVFINLSHTL